MQTIKTLPTAQTESRGLTGTALKTIALVLMILDHIHYFFGYTGLVPVWFTMLGRLSAPLFLFCTVEGFAHTHNRRAYFVRIWLIGAAMGFIQLLMMNGNLNRADGFYPQNAIFMQFTVLCIIWQGIDWLKAKKWLPGILAVILPLVWPVVASVLCYAVPTLQSMVGTLCFTLMPAWMMIMDGGWGYFAGGILLYLLHGHRKWQLTVWTVWTFYFDFIRFYLMLKGTEGFTLGQMFTTEGYFEWFAVFAVVLMALYNGKRGKGHKQVFYWFYPGHVYLLYGLSCLIYPLFG